MEPEPADAPSRGRHALAEVEPFDGPETAQEEYAPPLAPRRKKADAPAKKAAGRKKDDAPAKKSAGKKKDDAPAKKAAGKKKGDAPAKKAAGKGKKKSAPAPSEPDSQAVEAVLQVLEGGAAKKSETEADQAPAPDKASAPRSNKHEKKKPVAFRRDRAEKTPDEKGPLLSRRDLVGAIISMTAALVLLAATVVIWIYRDSFSPDALVLSVDTAATPKDEYIFDAGSGEAFAAAGQGLAVANASGLELLDSSGTPVTSMLMQMESPTATGCNDFALFYDLGGRRMAVARLDGTVEEISVKGDILSATVSEGGYIAVTTRSTGFRALVTVYGPELDAVYEYYSSSAWVISGAVSPDGRKLAVLSYTASGSEVRFFRLDSKEQQAAFPVDDTILLDLHWFSSDKLCALSSDQALFFNGSGEWENTYSFEGQYLIGYTFDGGNCAAFALSPYRAGTTATLVSLDSSGDKLGTAEIQSELVCLTARDLEIMVLCSDGAILYNSSLTEKSRLTGLPGFKYGLLRDRGEALLIASNYAEVYTF